MSAYYFARMSTSLQNITFNQMEHLYLTDLELINSMQLTSLRSGLKVLEDEGCLTAPKSKSVFELLNSENLNVSTGLSALDRTLLGGISAGFITEIAGPAGSGKTQLCCQLAINAALPAGMGGLSASVLYLDTESAVSSLRIKEILTSRYRLNDESIIKNILSQIFIVPATSSSALMNILTQLEQLVESHGICMVMVDSIASLLRSDQSGVNRTKLLLEQAAMLKTLAENSRVAVVVTNQIQTLYKAEEQNPTGSIAPGGDLGVAMGTAWAHCLTTRLTTQYLPNNRRKISVVKSSVSPCVSLEFRISESGLHQQGDLTLEPEANANPEKFYFNIDNRSKTYISLHENS